MGRIYIIKPLSTVLSIAVNKSQQHQEKNCWERWGSNPRLLGAKRERYPLCYGPHPPSFLLLFSPQSPQKPSEAQTELFSVIERSWNEHDSGLFRFFGGAEIFFAEGHSGAECFSAKSKTLLEILFDGKQWWGWFLGWRLFLSSRYFWLMGEFNKTAERPISKKWIDGAFRLENEWDAVVTIFDRHSCWGLYHKTLRIPFFR